MKGKLNTIRGSRTNWLFPRRKQRQEEAIERQEYYDSLLITERITIAINRRGNSKKELKKLRT